MDTASSQPATTDNLPNDAQEPVYGLVMDARGNRIAARSPITLYDFGNPQLISETGLRQLKSAHENVAQYVAAQLSVFFRIDVGLRVERIETQTFKKLTRSLPDPLYVSIFKDVLSSQNGFLAIPVRLGLAMVDRMLGGKGLPAEIERPLTQLENTLCDDFSLKVLEEWMKLYSSESKRTVHIIGYESDAKFLKICNADTQILVVTLRCFFAGQEASLTLAIPFGAVSSSIRTLTASSQQDALEEKPAKKQISISDLPVGCHGVKVSLTANLDAFSLRLGDFLKIQPGDIIELNPNLLEATQLCLGPKVIFWAQTGLTGQQIAVKITSTS